jgi:hypothetical protein
MKDFRSGPFTESRWKQFVRRYRSEMSAPEKSRMFDLLAALSHQTTFSAGCCCQDEEDCHRSVQKSSRLADNQLKQVRNEPLKIDPQMVFSLTFIEKERRIF